MATIPQFVEDANEAGVFRERPAKLRRWVQSFDIYLVLTVGILIALGLMMVWSTTFYWAEPREALFLQQLRNAVLGLLLMAGVGAVDYRIWRRLAIPLMLLVVLALVGLLVLPGIQSVFGARRAYFGGAVQPSEIAMFSVVIYMSAWLSSKQSKLRYLTYGLLPFTLLVGTVAGLIAMEPDLSTAFLVLITAGLMFFLAGADWIQLGLTTAVMTAGGFFAINTFDYAKSRIAIWLELLRDPIAAQASHAQNVIIAFLKGGIGGVGLGQSYQKFFNLPAPHTDSVFAVVGEELGLLGCALIITLYVVLLLRGFRIARNAPDLFGGLLASGVTVAIVIEALFNIAVMASIVPLIGVPLPFISFGGSSLIASLFGMGLIISVSRASARQATAPVRKVNETLNLPGMQGAISRLRNRPIDE